MIGVLTSISHLISTKYNEFPFCIAVDLLPSKPTSSEEITLKIIAQHPHNQDTDI